MIVCDTKKLGPLGFVKHFVVYLEVNGSRFELECTLTQVEAKTLHMKWQANATSLKLPFQCSQDATKFLG